MTHESRIWCLCGIILSTVLSVWSQSISPPNNLFPYKAASHMGSIQGQVVLKHLENGIGKKLIFYPLINQQEQYPYRQGYTSRPNQYQDSTKQNSQQHPLQQDSSQKTRNFVFADEPKPQLPSIDFTATSNHQPTYFPYHPNQKDSSYGDNAAYAKILNLANVLSRNPRPDASRNYEPMASASEVHQELCAPPNLPQNPPCTTPQPSPTRDPSCSQSPPPKSTPKPQCSQAKTPQPSTSSPPCLQPKLEAKNVQPPQPAPKFTPPKNPFQCDFSEQLSNPAVVPVSPLHPSSKHAEPFPESSCLTPPCPRKKSHECEVKPTCKQVVPIVPAAKPVVHNPFTENKGERVVPPPPKPRGVLHHRQHGDEKMGYPEGYDSKPETQSLILPQVSHYMYPTVGRLPHIPTMYPYVPPPMTKPIPLVVPADEKDQRDDFVGVYYPVVEDHIERPASKRYKDDWSSDVLRDIADRLDAILDDDFRDRRFFSRVYPDNEREYYDVSERSEDEPYARDYRNYYEEGLDNYRRKERKYSRAG